MNNSIILPSDDLSTINAYEAAATACIRAISGDITLTVGEPGDRMLDEAVVLVPRLESIDDHRKLARHRGLLDSFVFMKLYHDPVVHNRNAPANEVSERLFNLLERERFESLGSDRYAGARQNLASLWAGSYSAELMDRLGGVEQLELVISYLCREQTNAPWPPAHITRHVDLLRGPVESLIGEHLREMAMLRLDQQRYAETVLQLITQLGLDSERAQADTEADHVDDTSILSDTDNSEESVIDPSDDESDERAGEEQTTDAASDSENAALVRNAEDEQVVEPDLADWEQLTEHDTAVDSAPDAEQSSPSGYHVYDVSDDEEISALKLVTATELKALKRHLDHCVDKHTHLIRSLAARLQRHLMARQQRGWLYDQEEGELDTRRLPGLIIDPSTPVSYRVETEAQMRSTAVTILVDNSRSMLGRPIELAAVCTDLLTRTLERCGVSSEVLGFTTVSMYGGATKARWQQAGEHDNPGRLNSVRHIVYKSAQTPWRRAHERFAVMLKSDVLKQNIDGEALQWAHNRLLKRAEDKRLLIVVSDGAPSDAATLTANRKDLLVRHLQAVVTDIERHSSVHLLAIGIGHDVSAHYRHAMMIRDAAELPSALMNQLSDLLVNSESIAGA